MLLWYQNKCAFDSQKTIILMNSYDIWHNHSAYYARVRILQVQSDNTYAQIMVILWIVYSAYRFHIKYYTFCVFISLNCKKPLHFIVHALGLQNVLLLDRVKTESCYDRSSYIKKQNQQTMKFYYLMYTA